MKLHGSVWRKYALIPALALVLAILYAVSRQNYLLFHVLVEMFGAVTAFGLFIVAWNSRRFTHNNYLLFVGIAYLFVGVLTVLHTLAYKGMGVFPGNGANLATELWIATRYVASLSMLIAPAFLKRRMAPHAVVLTYAAVTALLIGSIFWGLFPDCYVEGQGLTPFKIASEYVISAVLGVSALLVLRRRQDFDPGVVRLLTGSIAVGVAAELAFTLYTDVYGLTNMLGHLLQILSYYLLYKAMIETSLSQPYHLLFRSLVQTQEELRRQNDFWHEVLESLSHPFYVIDAADYKVYMANTAARRGQQIENVTCYALTHRNAVPCQAAEHPCPLQTVRQTRQPVVVEHVHYDEQGGVRYDEIHGYPVLDAEGQVVQMIEYTLDVTQRKQAEAALARQTQELERSNAELEHFAYVASHDLQEPLRTVGSYVQLLARRYQGRLDADADEFIAYAVDGVTRMQDLIRGLLAYARVGTQGKEPAPTDCNALIERTLAALRVTIDHSGAQVTCAPLPVVMGDALQLGQVFQNLISNALKFRSQHPPRVHVSATHRPLTSDWLFSVRDNGIGIDPQQAGRIFEIFQRLHTRQEYPGTGIGLAICKKIVERHGGRIWFESQPGEGTTFYFTLPGKLQVAEYSMHHACLEVSDGS